MVNLPRHHGELLPQRCDRGYEIGSFLKLACLTADEIDNGDAKVEIELWDYKLRNHCLVKSYLLSCLACHQGSVLCTLVAAACICCVAEAVP